MGQFARVADQKVNVLRHDDIYVDAKAKAAAHGLEGVLKDSSGASVVNRGRR